MTNLLNTTVIYFSGTSISLGDSTIALLNQKTLLHLSKKKKITKKRKKREMKRKV